MASVPKSLADEIIAANGLYKDDPRVTRVVVYENQFDGTDTYAIIYARENPRRYHESPACHNVRVYWDYAH